MDFYYDIDFIIPNDEPPFDTSSDDDELELTLAIAIEKLNNEGALTSHRHSVQPRKFIWHNPLQGYDRLFHDYFAETSVYWAPKHVNVTSVIPIFVLHFTYWAPKHGHVRSFITKYHQF